MKASLPLVVGVLALLLALFTLFSGGKTDGVAKAEIIEELAPAMGDMQRFAEKLYFAGQAGNWPLADFYLHEIEETVEKVIKSNIVDEGVPVSSFMKTMFPPSVEGIKGPVKARDAAQFAARYEGLISSCNACHQATQHGFVKITVPRQPTYENQDFRP